MIVFKPGSIPTLYQEFQTLLGLCHNNRLEKSAAGWQHAYRWVDELRCTDSDKREWKLKAIHYKGAGPEGQSSEWAWLVSPDLKVNARGVSTSRRTVESLRNLVWPTEASGEGKTQIRLDSS